MSQLSGYDSEAVGFDSITKDKQLDVDGSTQTSEFFEAGTGTQTMASKSCGTNVKAADLEQSGSQTEYPPPGLNDFLKRVVPSMLEQLDLNEREIVSDSSDSDCEEIITAKLFQKIDLFEESKGSGDSSPDSILSLSWSSPGSSIAVSIGRTYHDEWCQHDGKIKIFSTKRNDTNKLIHFHELLENSCISMVLYHPSVSALLAYGTLSGVVGICNLRSVNYEGCILLKSPFNCHGSKMITSLRWADTALSNSLLALKLTGKRHGSTDQVLFSAGSDGTINVWQVNANLNVFELIICYKLNGINKLPAEDITCFDFLKDYSDSSSVDNDIFVVGTKSGKIMACKTKTYQKILDMEAVDPVYQEFEGVTTCILNIVSIVERGGFFVSLSTDGELKIYNVTQKSPIKVIQLEEPVSRMAHLNGPVLAFGLAKTSQLGNIIKLYNLSTERFLSIDGLRHDGGSGSVTVTSLSCSSMTRVAVGDDAGAVRIWDIPLKLRHNSNF